MKKFGFGRKKDDGGDPGRDALYGDKKNKGGASNGGNPYATAAGANDPYMNNAGPPAYNESRGGGPDRFRNDKSPAYSGGYGGGGNEPPPRDRFGGGAGGPPPDRFGGPPGGDRYGPGNYGSTGGFGQRPYGDSAPAQPAGSRYGTGGYGGFGGANGSAEHGGGGRDELFAGARRNEGRSQGQGAPAYGAYGQGPPADEADNRPSGAGPGYGAPEGYEAQEERVLSPQEQEDLEVDQIKDQIRNERIDTVKSTDRSLNLLQNSLAIGRETVERLDRQGESLHNTKRNLELANNKSKQAADKTRDLKRLDKSIFNPRSYVTVKPSARDREDEIRENSRSALRKQNASRSDAANRSGGMQTKTAASAADRAKYLLEPTSEDEANEEQIETNVADLTIGTRMLRGLASDIGGRIDEHNKYLDGLSGQTDDVKEGIEANTERIRRIK